MRNRIRFARGTKSQLNQVNAIIPAGVPLYTTDENMLYIGDGVKKGNQLDPVETPHSLTADNAQIAALANTVTFVTTPPTTSPAEGSLVVYVGTTLPSTRVDRVLYLITRS